jgi:N-acetylneuraminate synthase
MSVFVIAEAGVNHNGSLELALQLVDAAACAGADAVKFQTFRAADVVSIAAPKCGYQEAATGEGGSQLEMIRQLELRREFHYPISKRCAERGVVFMSTGFDASSVRFLADDLGVAILKIPSGEIDNAPLLLEIARFGKPMILSTGMSTLGEVEMALGVLAFGLLRCQAEPSERAFQESFASRQGRALLEQKVRLLHCTTEYPAPPNEANLRVLDVMRAAFGLRVGLSDHTRGIAVPIAAAAMGAETIEKHFTLDRELPGPDHKASLEPAEFAGMVEGIRTVEAAMGCATKVPTESEWRNRPIVRRSLVAARGIAAGERFSGDNIAAKRPASGLSPMRYWDLLGRRARRGYEPDQLIDRGEL